MRLVLTALHDELKRLQYEGVDAIPLAEDTLDALRALAPPPAAAPVETAPPSPPSAAPAGVARKPEPPPPPAPEFPPPPTVALPDTPEKQPRWDALLAQVRADPVCLKNLRPGKKTVLGTGNLDAKIMFIGEAPGAEEEIQGEPFVGPAGQLLTKMITGMGIRRGDVYIGNIMNWRPPLPTPDGAEQVGNRPPTDAEMAYCLPYLRAQIAIVAPEILVALGASAAQAMLGHDAFKSLGEIRGHWREFDGKPLLVTYHPSYILRQSRSTAETARRAKRAIWEDLLKVMERAALPVSDKQRNYFKT